MGLGRGVMPCRGGSVAGIKAERPRMPFPGEQSLSPALCQLPVPGHLRGSSSRSHKGAEHGDTARLLLCPIPRWVPPAGGQQRDAHLAGTFCFAFSLFSPFSGGGGPYRRHGGIAERGGDRVLFFCRVVGATKGTAEGQDRRLSSRRRDTRAPSACPCSSQMPAWARCLRGAGG